MTALRPQQMSYSGPQSSPKVLGKFSSSIQALHLHKKYPTTTRGCALELLWIVPCSELRPLTQTSYLQSPEIEVYELPLTLRITKARRPAANQNAGAGGPNRAGSSSFVDAEDQLGVHISVSDSQRARDTVPRLWERTISYQVELISPPEIYAPDRDSGSGLSPELSAFFLSKTQIPTAAAAGASAALAGADSCDSNVGPRKSHKRILECVLSDRRLTTGVADLRPWSAVVDFIWTNQVRLGELHGQRHSSTPPPAADYSPSVSPGETPPRPGSSDVDASSPIAPRVKRPSPPAATSTKSAATFVLENIHDATKIPAEPFIVVSVNIHLHHNPETFLRKMRDAAMNARKTHGVVGLKNHGATCYVNVLLQILFHLSCFRSEIYRLGQSAMQQGRHPSPAVVELQRIFYNLETSNSSVSTLDFMQAIDRNPGIQQDAHEFLSEFFLQKVLKRVTDLFSIKVKMVTRCTKVNFSSAAEDKLLMLNLAVTGCPTIEHALQKELAAEKLEFLYDTDDPKFGKQEAERQMQLVTLPPVLFIHSKRFNHLMRKLHESQELAEQLDVAGVMYTLHSVVIHSGTSIHSGHYTAFIRLKPDQYYLFDDESVTRVPREDVFVHSIGTHWIYPACSGYILTYVKQDLFEELTTKFEPAPPSVIARLTASKQLPNPYNRLSGGGVNPEGNVSALVKGGSPGSALTKPIVDSRVLSRLPPILVPQTLSRPEEWAPPQQRPEGPEIHTSSFDSVASATAVAAGGGSTSTWDGRGVPGSLSENTCPRTIRVVAMNLKVVRDFEAVLGGSCADVIDFDFAMHRSSPLSPEESYLEATYRDHAGFVTLNVLETATVSELRQMLRSRMTLLSDAREEKTGGNRGRDDEVSSQSSLYPVQRSPTTARPSPAELPAPTCGSATSPQRKQRRQPSLSNTVTDDGFLDEELHLLLFTRRKNGTLRPSYAVYDRIEDTAQSGGTTGAKTPNRTSDPVALGGDWSSQSTALARQELLRYNARKDEPPAGLTRPRLLRDIIEVCPSAVATSSGDVSSACLVLKLLVVEGLELQDSVAAFMEASQLSMSATITPQTAALSANASNAALPSFAGAATHHSISAVAEKENRGSAAASPVVPSSRVSRKVSTLSRGSGFECSVEDLAPPSSMTSPQASPLSASWGRRNSDAYFQTARGAALGDGDLEALKRTALRYRTLIDDYSQGSFLIIKMFTGLSTMTCGIRFCRRDATLWSVRSSLLSKGGLLEEFLGAQQLPSIALQDGQDQYPIYEEVRPERMDLLSMELTVAEAELGNGDILVVDCSESIKVCVEDEVKSSPVKMGSANKNAQSAALATSILFSASDRKDGANTLPQKESAPLELANPISSNVGDLTSLVQCESLNNNFHRLQSVGLQLSPALYLYHAAANKCIRFTLMAPLDDLFRSANGEAPIGLGYTFSILCNFRLDTYDSIISKIKRKLIRHLHRFWKSKEEEREGEDHADGCEETSESQEAKNDSLDNSIVIGTDDADRNRRASKKSQKKITPPWVPEKEVDLEIRLWARKDVPHDWNRGKVNSPPPPDSPCILVDSHENRTRRNPNSSPLQQASALRDFSRRTTDISIPGAPLDAPQVDEKVEMMRLAVGELPPESRLIGTKAAPLSVLNYMYPSALSVMLSWHNETLNPGPDGAAPANNCVLPADSTLGVARVARQIYFEVSASESSQKVAELTEGSSSGAPPTGFVKNLTVNWMGDTRTKVLQRVHVERVPKASSLSVLIPLVGYRVALFDGGLYFDDRFAGSPQPHQQNLPAARNATAASPQTAKSVVLVSGQQTGSLFGGTSNIPIVFEPSPETISSLFLLVVERKNFVEAVVAANLSDPVGFSGSLLPTHRTFLDLAMQQRTKTDPLQLRMEVSPVLLQFLVHCTETERVAVLTEHYRLFSAAVKGGAISAPSPLTQAFLIARNAIFVVFHVNIRDGVYFGSPFIVSQTTSFAGFKEEVRRAVGVTAFEEEWRYVTVESLLPSVETLTEGNVKTMEIKDEHFYRELLERQHAQAAGLAYSGRDVLLEYAAEISMANQTMEPSAMMIELGGLGSDPTTTVVDVVNILRRWANPFILPILAYHLEKPSRSI